MNYILNPKAIERIRSGERLLTLDDFADESILKEDEGEVVRLSDAANYFVAKALIGHQHKGLGWVFTDCTHVNWNPDFVDQCIQTARQVREKAGLIDNQATTAYRLFNGEGDGIGGVTVDWYAGYLQINWYSKGIYQYREWFQQALLDYYPSILGIYETLRFYAGGTEVPEVYLTYGEPAPQSLVILENQVKYAVYLGQEWMTGIFLDQREVRDFLKTQATGGSVLNLFSYTGAFSVAAAVGGADRTVSVDVANRSLDRTQEQFQLNEIIPTSDRHEIRVMDVFNYLDYALRHQLQFDWVVCDPPSFARTKNYLFRAEEDYAELARHCFALTKPGGICILSTNHAGYSRERFQADIQRTVQSFAGDLALIQSFAAPVDYPHSADQISDYLKVLVYYRSH